MRKTLAVIILVFGISILIGCGQQADHNDSISKPLRSQNNIKSSSNGRTLEDNKRVESSPVENAKNRGDKIMVESKSPNDKEMKDVYDDIEKEIQGLMSDLEQLEEDSSYMEQGEGSPQEVGL